MLVDQIDRLRTQCVPNEPSGDVGGADGLINVSKPAVVVAEIGQHRIRTECLPQLGDDAVRRPESILRDVIGDG